jgi:ribosomal-protein-alanine N-acetyltransferase
MHIRPYSLSDKPILLELFRLNTPHYFAPEEEQDFIQYLDNRIEHYFVIEDDGKIVGCAGLNTADNGTTAVLSWDIIHPNSQGKGIGSRLTQHRINLAKTMPGVEKIRVRTSQLVYPFYAKFGFEVKEISKDYWASGFDMYLMEMDFVR